MAMITSVAMTMTKTITMAMAMAMTIKNTLLDTISIIYKL